MKNLITDKEYDRTIDKIRILGIKNKELNDWAELMNADECRCEYDERMEEFTVSMLGEQPITIIVRNKKTIIKNIEHIIYHTKYLVIEFKDKTSLIVTRKGKIVDLNKYNYSERLNEKFKLIYVREYNRHNSNFIVTKVDGDRQSIVVINENGKAIKINTGMEIMYASMIDNQEVGMGAPRIIGEGNRRIRNNNENDPDRAVITITGTYLGRTIGRLLSLTEKLNVSNEGKWRDDGTLTWECL